jgi:hypothetical protein
MRPNEQSPFYHDIDQHTPQVELRSALLQALSNTKNRLRTQLEEECAISDKVRLGVDMQKIFHSLEKEIANTPSDFFVSANKLIALIHVFQQLDLVEVETEGQRCFEINLNIAVDIFQQIKRIVLETAVVAAVNREYALLAYSTHSHSSPESALHGKHPTEPQSIKQFFLHRLEIAKTHALEQMDWRRTEWSWYEAVHLRLHLLSQKITTLITSLPEDIAGHEQICTYIAQCIGSVFIFQSKELHTKENILLNKALMEEIGRYIQHLHRLYTVEKTTKQEKRVSTTGFGVN